MLTYFSLQIKFKQKSKPKEYPVNIDITKRSPFGRLPYSHPKDNHELACWHNNQGEEGGGAGEEEDWGGIHGNNKGWIEEKAKVRKIRRPRKEVLGCVQAVVGKKKFWVRFKDWKLKETSTGQLVIISGQEEESKGGEESRVENIEKAEG